MSQPSSQDSIKFSPTVFFKAFEHSTNHLVITDIDGQIIFANKAAETMTGYSFEEMKHNTPRLWGRMMPREFYDNLWDTIKNKQKPFDGEIKNRRKNGEEYEAIVHISPIFDDNNNLIGYIGSEEDITQLKKTEKELEVQLTNYKSEISKVQSILESIGDAVIVTDGSGNIMRVNSVAEQLLGIQENNVYKNKYTSIIQAKTLTDKPIPDAERLISKVIETQNKQVQEMKYILPDKSDLTVSTVGSPIMLHGKLMGVVQIIRDVTREKQIDRMKTEFISLASHQLRTPLSAIRWFAEMLLNGDVGELNAGQKEFTQNIYDSTERMIKLVNALLNISRIESGKIIIDPHPTDIIALAKAAIQELDQKLHEKKQNLIISFHKDLPKISLDEKLIYEVFMNLLTNAIKYSPEKGEITLFVSRKKDIILVQISDTGYGISEKDKERIFQKFFRGENILKFETDGTGLGLYLVKAIIESSGGKIWFESKENKGTTFWFELPIHGVAPNKGTFTLSK